MRNIPTLEIADYSILQYEQWNEKGIAIWWLGQAGFLLRYKNINIIVDAYLSNVLEQKYKHSEFSHERMMDAPIPMNKLTNIQYCFSSHSHSDHMDPGFLPILNQFNPDCKVIVPEATYDIALKRGVPHENIIGINANNTVILDNNMSVTAIPAAHETLMQDDNNNYFFLGYIFFFGSYTVYHSGDCLPYKELGDWLKNYNIDIALLPVNGKRQRLSQKGIAGNFSIEEACKLVRHQNISYMIPHHYGMFAFNTISHESFEKTIKESDISERIFPANTLCMFYLY